jgi:hypothetical protein
MSQPAGKVIDSSGVMYDIAATPIIWRPGSQIIQKKDFQIGLTEMF